MAAVPARSPASCTQRRQRIRDRSSLARQDRHGNADPFGHQHVSVKHLHQRRRTGSRFHCRRRSEEQHHQLSLGLVRTRARRRHAQHAGKPLHCQPPAVQWSGRRRANANSIEVGGGLSPKLALGFISHQSGAVDFPAQPPAALQPRPATLTSAVDGLLDLGGYATVGGTWPSAHRGNSLFNQGTDCLQFVVRAQGRRLSTASRRRQP